MSSNFTSPRLRWPLAAFLSFAIAAVIVLIHRPETLMSPGFQMSFAATTALVGQNIGAGDHEEARRSTYVALRVAWVYSGLMVVLFVFATRYLVGFAPLPAFRHLTPEEYRDKVAELIGEIRDEGERARDGNPVAGVEKILSQDPYRPPTRRPKRSPRARKLSTT